MAAPVAPELKAAALADLVAGEPLKTTARKHGVSHQQLRQWRSAAGIDPVLTPSAREAIWKEVDLYLVEALQTMRVQLKVSRDEAYLKSHDTAGLAALHNAIAEKVARMVEAEEEAPMGAPVPIRRAS